MSREVPLTVRSPRGAYVEGHPEHDNDQLVVEYLTWLRDVRRRTGGTIYNYEGVLGRWCSHLGPKPFAGVAPQDVESFLSRRRPIDSRARGAAGAAATLAKEWSILHAFYGYLDARHGVRNVVTLAGKPTPRNRQPRPIPDDVWRKLWFAAGLPDDARVALALGFFVGLRRHEITSLRPDHFVTSGPADTPVAIVGLKRKGGGEDAIDLAEMVAFWAQAHPHLIGTERSVVAPMRRLLGAQRNERTLLPWTDVSATVVQARKHGLAEGAIDPQRMNKRMRSWLRIAGMPSESLTPHQLRHSFVTNLLRAGVPLEVVCDLADHSSPRVTMLYAKTAGRLSMWLSERPRTNRHTG